MSSRATMFSCFILDSKNRKQTSPFKKKKKTAFDVNCSQKCCSTLPVRTRCLYRQMVVHAGDKNLLCAVESIAFLR